MSILVPVLRQNVAVMYLFESEMTIGSLEYYR